MKELSQLMRILDKSLYLALVACLVGMITKTKHQECIKISIVTLSLILHYIGSMITHSK
nr:MAG TPA: hypothetical protein [Caudoviricetes sp.]